MSSSIFLNPSFVPPPPRDGVGCCPPEELVEPCTACFEQHQSAKALQFKLDQLQISTVAAVSASPSASPSTSASTSGPNSSSSARIIENGKEEGSKGNGSGNDDVKNVEDCDASTIAPPPEIPHGHAASPPEHATNHNKSNAAMNPAPDKSPTEKRAEYGSNQISNPESSSFGPSIPPSSSFSDSLPASSSNVENSARVQNQQVKEKGKPPAPSNKPGGKHGQQPFQKQLYQPQQMKQYQHQAYRSSQYRLGPNRNALTYQQQMANHHNSNRSGQIQSQSASSVHVQAPVDGNSHLMYCDPNGPGYYPHPHHHHPSHSNSSPNPMLMSGMGVPHSVPVQLPMTMPMMTMPMSMPMSMPMLVPMAVQMPVPMTMGMGMALPLTTFTDIYGNVYTTTVTAASPYTTPLPPTPLVIPAQTQTTTSIPIATSTPTPAIAVETASHPPSLQIAASEREISVPPSPSSSNCSSLFVPRDASPSPSPIPSPSSSSSSRLTNSTYKTEICRSHQSTGVCDYADQCQFAHGLSELRTRQVDTKYKTELCSSYHSNQGSAEGFDHNGSGRGSNNGVSAAIGNCWYGSRCKFVHDEYRVRVASHEFWLISPRDNLVRVERVDPMNHARIQQLLQFIRDQTGSAAQAAAQVSAAITGGPAASDAGNSVAISAVAAAMSNPSASSANVNASTSSSSATALPMFHAVSVGLSQPENVGPVHAPHLVPSPLSSPSASSSPFSSNAAQASKQNRKPFQPHVGVPAVNFASVNPIPSSTSRRGPPVSSLPGLASPSPRHPNQFVPFHIQAVQTVAPSHRNFGPRASATTPQTPASIISPSNRSMMNLNDGNSPAVHSSSSIFTFGSVSPSIVSTAAGSIAGSAPGSEAWSRTSSDAFSTSSAAACAACRAAKPDNSNSCPCQEAASALESESAVRSGLATGEAKKKRRVRRRKNKHNAENNADPGADAGAANAALCDAATDAGADADAQQAVGLAEISTL